MTAKKILQLSYKFGLIIFMNNNQYLETNDNQMLRPMFERRPSSLVRYRHGGYNALFPIKIDGLAENILTATKQQHGQGAGKKTRARGAKIIQFPRTATALTTRKSRR